MDILFKKGDVYAIFTENFDNALELKVAAHSPGCNQVLLRDKDNNNFVAPVASLNNWIGNGQAIQVI